MKAKIVVNLHVINHTFFNSYRKVDIQAVHIFHWSVSAQAWIFWHPERALLELTLNYLCKWLTLIYISLSPF